MAIQITGDAKKLPPLYLQYKNGNVMKQKR